MFEALAGGDRCSKQLAASVLPDGEGVPAVCVTAIEARLYCEGLGLRLPTPEEWRGALDKIPVVKLEDDERPFSRGPLAEWTMIVTHGTPTFEIQGAEAVEGAPVDLKPNEYSDKVGFRCAFSFEE